MPDISTTNQKIYIVDIGRESDFSAQKKYERLDIQFLPKEINMPRTANIADIEVIGRNNPLHHFTGGDETISLELDFYCDSGQRDAVIKKIRWLQSVAINDGYFGKASRVVLIWGDLYKGDAKWVVKSVVPKMSNFSSKFGFLPQQAYVQLTMALDTNYSLTKSQLRS